MTCMMCVNPTFDRDQLLQINTNISKMVDNFCDKHKSIWSCMQKEVREENNIKCQ